MKPQPEAPALAWARGRRGNPGAGGAPAARVRSSAAESQEVGPRRQEVTWSVLEFGMLVPFLSLVMNLSLGV